ncbi:MAG TPA: DUF4214 domain-containing protein [Candidatus Contendobacter sp.]|nr:DUF4214 domain-containing protein [Candidatus Contendobacter sp.]HRD49593.1 DUF4214 domain-containing protein [Candidatus Contendobacter sp.]
MASTASTTYVNGLYTNLIGFTDPAGVAAWAGQIDAGTSPYNVANAFLNVYQQSAAPVALLYQAAFGRVPDYDGFTYWLNNFKTVSAGNTLLLSQQFYNSAEFAARIGGDPTTLTDSDYVLALYQNVLGRPGDFNGATYWVNWLTAAEAAGGNTDAAKDAARNQLLDVFAASGENVSNNGKQIETFTVYAAFDGRAPTTAEFTAAQSQSELTVVSGVVATSPNYGATGAAPVPVFPLTFTPDVTTVTEGNAVTFTVNLNTPALADSTYTFNINGATNPAITQAASSADFVAANGSFSVKAGATAGTFKVSTVTGDGTEPLEGFKVSLLDAKLNPLLESAILAIQDNPGGGGVGQTYVLTTGVDAFSTATSKATSGDDIYIASIATIANGGTLNTGDFVDGSAGTDRLNVTSSDNAVAMPVTTLNSVEQVYIRNSAAGTTKLDATTWTGVQQVWADTSIAGSLVTVDNLQNNVTLGLNNVAVTDDTDVLTANFTAGKVGGSTATLAIVTNNTGTTTPVARANIQVNPQGTDVFTTVDITATGKNNVVLQATDATDVNLNTIKVGGTGSLTFAGDAAANVAFTNITTVDLAANSGGVTLNLSTSTKDIVVTGGSGNDSLTIDLAVNGKMTLAAGAGNDTVILGTPTAADLAATDSISGGDGTADVLALTSAGVVNLSADPDRTVLTNFEILRVTDAIGADLNISKFGLNYLQVGTAQAAAWTVSGFTSGATVETRAAASFTASLGIGITNATNAGTQDTLNIKLNADLPAAATVYDVLLGVPGIETLNISTADQNVATVSAAPAADGYKLVTPAAGDANITTINLTGDRYFEYAATATSSAIATVNAAGLSGNLKIDLTAFAGTQGVVVTGGSGTNTLTGSAKGDILTGGAKVDTLSGLAGDDTISGGAGNDNITGGAGKDTLTGGDGADTFVYTTLTDSVLSPATDGPDRIIDLVAGTDKIDVTTVPATILQGAAFTAVGTGALSTDIASALANGGGVGIAANAVAVVTITGTGAGTYLIINDGTVGYLNTADAVINITGVSGTLATTDFV